MLRGLNGFPAISPMAVSYLAVVGQPSQGFARYSELDVSGMSSVGQLQRVFSRKSFCELEVVQRRPARHGL